MAGRCVNKDSVDVWWLVGSFYEGTGVLQVLLAKRGWRERGKSGIDAGAEN